MIDPMATLVTAVTHAGFRMAHPVNRRLWGPAFGAGPQSLRERLVADSSFAEALASEPEIEAELERLAEQGIEAITLFSDAYPERWLRAFGDRRPPVVFAQGDVARLNRPGIAVVGSRNADERALEFAESCGRAAAERGWILISGGARGIDLAAIVAACRAGGEAVILAADSLKEIRKRLVRSEVDPEQVTAATVFHPDSGFSVGQAMGRNKLIYALARSAVVAACEEGTGGTWSGATEALEHDWSPVCVWVGLGAPKDNLVLERRGAIPVKEPGELFETRHKPRAPTLFEE